MARAVDQFLGGDDRETGLVRGRGGWWRKGFDGPPYVTDPTDAVTKSGKRKGEPKRLQYGSPSNFGSQIENPFNLIKWAERREALGFGLSTSQGDYSLLAMAHELAQLEVDSDDYKTLGDTIVARAKDIAEASLAADRGTHAHGMTETEPVAVGWERVVEAGRALGMSREAHLALFSAWNRMLNDNNLEIVATEVSCVDDVWRLAGTLDRIVRCNRELRFSLITGEVRAIPAGSVIVLDIKTGQRRLDRDGTVRYWHKYGPQVASYAQSLPYDTVTEQRGVWPWPIDQSHALIAHLDVLAALDGNARCDLVYVDLVAAREHGGATVLAAKAWERRRDVFSIAQLADEKGDADGADQAGRPDRDPGCVRQLEGIDGTVGPAPQHGALWPDDEAVAGGASAAGRVGAPDQLACEGRALSGASSTPPKSVTAGAADREAAGGDDASVSNPAVATIAADPLTEDDRVEAAAQRLVDGKALFGAPTPEAIERFKRDCEALVAAQREAHRLSLGIGPIAADPLTEDGQQPAGGEGSTPPPPAGEPFCRECDYDRRPPPAGETEPERLYDKLRREISAVAKSVYIVNEKRPPSYDRQWKIYVLHGDGTNNTIWTADDDNARDRGMREALQTAKQHLGCTSLLDVAPPDEGAPADPDAVAALRRRYEALPDAVRGGWLRDLAEQAAAGVNGRGRVPYTLGPNPTGGCWSARRYSITAGLVCLAEGGGVG